MRIIMAVVSKIVVRNSDLSGAEGAESVVFDVQSAVRDTLRELPGKLTFDATPDEIDEIDSALTDALTNYVESVNAILADAVAVVASLKAAGSETKGGSASRVSGDSDAKAVREWARANGIVVADRGRIHADVLKAYADAHRTETAPVESWDNSVEGDGDVTTTDGPTDDELEALESETV